MHFFFSACVIQIHSALFFPFSVLVTFSLAAKYVGITFHCDPTPPTMHVLPFTP